MNDVFLLIKSLISIPSISGEEYELSVFLSDMLEKEGFAVNKIPVSPTRFCVYATLGTPHIVLEAHMDTVSPFIPYSEDSHFVYGRGACDTKGSIACMLTAAIEAKNENINNFGLLFTVGEEEDFIGAQKVLAQEKALPFMIVGEPTSLSIVKAHFGLFACTVTTKGKAAHSSKPEEGINAIEKLLPIISRIQTMPRHKETILTLAKISGGIAGNIIPDEAMITCTMRVSPEDKYDYASQLTDIIGNEGTIAVYETLPSVNFPIPPELSFLHVSPDVKYCTELSLFQKGVIIGPGDIVFAHSQNEKVPKKELIEGKNIYKKLLALYSR